MKIELKAIFIGKVQGVFFRAHVKKYADEKGITGYVKNLPDGSVEVRAIGEKGDLDKFIERIKSSPGFGKVDKVIVDYSEKCGKYTGFSSL